MENNGTNVSDALQIQTQTQMLSENGPLPFLHQHTPVDISSCESTDPTCATIELQISSKSHCLLRTHRILLLANLTFSEFPAIEYKIYEMQSYQYAGHNLRQMYCISCQEI